MQTVSFISLGARDFRCRETGTAYAFEPYVMGAAGVALAIFKDGEYVAMREHRDHALAYIEQDARLDFHTAQSESAWTNSDIQLDEVRLV